MSTTTKQEELRARGLGVFDHEKYAELTKAWNHYHEHGPCHLVAEGVLSENECIKAIAQWTEEFAAYPNSCGTPVTSNKRQQELSNWPIIEPQRELILLGLSFGYDRGAPPTDEELKLNGCENESLPSAPKTDEEKHFIETIIRPAARHCLNYLQQLLELGGCMDSAIYTACAESPDKAALVLLKIKKSNDKKTADLLREKQSHKQEKMRANTAERMNKEGIMKILPAVETGFESLADKVALKKKGRGKNKHKDVPLAVRRKENMVYAHWTELPSRMTYKKFAKEFPSHQLTAEELGLLIRRVKKRILRGTK